MILVDEHPGNGYGCKRLQNKAEKIRLGKVLLPTKRNNVKWLREVTEIWCQF